MPLFADSRKRIDRAMEHAKTFDAQWKAFINPESWKTIIEMNSDWTEGVVKVVAVRPLPNNDLALELGEMFYQLRASLDAAVYQAAILSGGFASTTDENRVEFPIYSSLDQFKRNPINKFPFPNDLRDWLESIQPYNIDKAPNLAIIRALQLLHDCARKDRHRRLHLVAAYPTSIQTQWIISSPGRIVSIQRLPANFLEDKTEFMSFQFEGALPETNIKIELNTDTLVEIAIDEIPSDSSQELGSKINWIFTAAVQMIDHFEQRFSL